MTSSNHAALDWLVIGMLAAIIVVGLFGGGKPLHSNDCIYVPDFSEPWGENICK